MSKKNRYEIRLFCIQKCNHTLVYDLFNNTVVCSDDRVKSDRMTSAILIIRLENKVVMA